MELTGDRSERGGPWDPGIYPGGNLMLWERTSEPRRKDKFQGERHSAGQPLSPP